MKISILKIILLFTLLIALVSVFGSVFANAQTEAYNPSPGQRPAAPGSKTASFKATPSSPSGIDPNAPAAVQPPSKASDPDYLAPRPAGVSSAAVLGFKFVAGSAFYPRSSTITFAESGGGGCIYQTGGNANGVFVADVQFPEGAIIDLIRLYYYDADNTKNSDAWLTQYDGAGGFTDVALVASAGNSGYGNTASPLDKTVANANHSLVLNWRSNLPGTTLALCGMRIRYFWMNANLLYLPWVMNNSH